ncbi:hypothetical protein HZC08_02050 [Candidatus Micrarchaeota archaeon]|nr:hypothetical protein [Candidatus Micrarchaeota archaeon]
MAVLRNKDIQKLSKEDAQKKLDELERSLLELEKYTQKRNPIKKAIARLKTFLHALETSAAKSPKKAELKTSKPKTQGEPKKTQKAKLKNK